MTATQSADVIIAGGGLAGLSLARQLKTSTPELDILVLERNTFPIPETTAKIGESTVEIASHYFTETLGLKQHFREQHLQKHGLRCFFGQPQADFADQDELGVSELFGIPTYQIDRGVIENHLSDEVRRLGVTVIDGATTERLDLSNGKHTVRVATSDGERRFRAKWLIDAAGRQRLLKNKLGLDRENPHKGNAVWFRVDKRIVLDEWSDNQGWHQRLKEPGKRWLSTNHLMGAGYWVWVIPLGTGATSIGIVLDDQALEESGITDFTSTMRWLAKEQPHCAAAVADASLMDFGIIRNYSTGCKQMFSDDGWCLTGEAGAFTDPFYAPGSDFIALNNTFISHLVAREKQGQDIRLDSAVFHIFYNSFFESTLSLYTHQYGGFGDRKMMAIKLLWDYAYYWGILTLLFYRHAITDIDLMREINPLLRKAQDYNLLLQERLRDRAAKRLVLPAQGLFLDQYQIPCLTHFNDILKAGDSIDLRHAIEQNVVILERLVGYLQDMLEDDAALAISEGERELMGDYRKLVLA